MTENLNYHVLCISTDKHHGGIDYMMTVYEKALSELGCTVTSVGYRQSPAMNKPSPASVRRVFLGQFWFLSLIFNPRFLRKMRTLIQEADIVISHNVSPLKKLLFLKKLIPHIRKTPLVLVDHSDKTKPNLNMDFVITVNNEMRDRILKTHPRFAANPDCVFILPNAIIAPPDYKKDRVFHKPLRLGGLGRFVNKKGFELLIDLLALPEQAATRLLIYGEGETRRALESRALAKNVAARLSMPGWTDDIQQFFNKIDILCVPSREEHFGLIMIEAMAAGVPVITTPTEGGSMIIRDRENGLIVPRSTAAFSEAIETLKDADLRKTCVAQARADFEAHYTFAPFCDRLRETLQHIVTRGALNM